jgi:hypothetical protein
LRDFFGGGGGISYYGDIKGMENGGTLLTYLGLSEV